MQRFIVLAIVLMMGVGSYFLLSEPLDGDDQGGITVVVIDESGTEFSRETYEFVEEVSLFDFMNEHYELGCASASYTVDSECGFMMMGSHVILKINELETDWSTSYIQILINDESSQYGIDLIMLEDETTYTFKYVSLGGDTE